MERNLPGLASALAEHGLMLRGAFHPGPGDKGLAETGTVALVGNAGPSLWNRFRDERRDEANPLDEWTRRIVDGIAVDCGASTVHPSDGPPYPPFQQWALRAEPVYSSPIGILIHPEYGLWHAYRAAVLFAERLDLPDWVDAPNPCDSCEEKPCLSTCPVRAFSGDGYDVPACVAHTSTAAGADCMALGCRARLACPIGRDYHYEPDQADFHMQAFLAPRAIR